MRTSSTPAKKSGRPLGRNKSPRNLTLDTKIVEVFAKIAFAEGVSFSAYVERALREKLATLPGKKRVVAAG